MSEIKHTPTPWTQDGYEVISSDGDQIATTVYCGYLGGIDGEANAAHIVKCVNMHDDLISQLVILKDSITGNCYLGEEAEISIIESLLKKAGAL